MAEQLPHEHEVTVKVNKKPVTLTGPKRSGAEIKKAAIEQGVQIELDFQLAELRANGERLIVGDDDIVTINKNSEFVATATDDNS